MKPPAIETIVDAPTLQPSAGYDSANMKERCGKQRGLEIELVESGNCDHPENPLVCKELAGEDGTLYAWFLASDIRAGTLSDPTFFLSVDAMVSKHRPRIPYDSSRLYDGYALYLCPEKEW